MQHLLPEERWTQIEALFQEAADLPAERREEFLNARCGGDPQLREEVLSLLRYDTGPMGAAEEAPLLDALQASAASVVTDEPAAGRLLGPYRIEREIGRGGMSVVYSAVRADGEFQKRVAIKLIKRGMDTRSVIERLRQERRILAALEHPSIARLLDGGTTPDGLPWIAMEYVEGLSIHRYCADRNLTIEERCRLIDKVCDAVAYAHRNLVIHRDLKPSNILIAPDGSPKLLDFGIAKLLADGEDQGADGPLTRGHLRPFTPEYASPEQIRGGPVGTSADVYSLGVVLYELLAGQRPRKEAEMPGTEKASEAARRAGKDHRWSRKLAGDLDNILEKAMREDPERRYLTVEQLQADLRRYLAGLPVSARPETWHYRFGKFLKRHPAGAVVALVAVLAAVVLVRVERDAQLQRAQSEQRLGELVALANTTLFDLHGAIENLPGATQARLEIARKTTESLDRLATESGNDPRVLTALASAYTRVARVQGNPKAANLGDHGSSEQNYLKAERILAGLMAHSNATELLLQDAGIHHEYGQLLSYKGQEAEALAQYRLALDQVGTVLARDPRLPDARKLNTRIHLSAADATKYADRPGTRRDLLDLLPTYEALIREYPQETEPILDLATFWDIMGTTYDQEGNLADAADSLRKSAALREELFARQPEDEHVQHDLMGAYGHLGDITGGPAVINMGDYRGAIVWFGKAAAMAERMAAADPSNALARSDVGIATMRIGVSQVAAGDNRQALETFKRAEPILHSALAASPESEIVAQTMAFLYRYKAEALYALGDQDAAITTIRGGLDLCRLWLAKVPDNISWNHLRTIHRSLLAIALASSGQTEEAFSEARSLLDSLRQRQIPNDLSTHAYLARVLSTNGSLHSIQAKRVTGGERISEWRAAADFYRRAMDEWQLHPSRMKEPFLSDMRATEAALAETERELR